MNWADWWDNGRNSSEGKGEKFGRLIAYGLGY